MPNDRNRRRSRNPLAGEEELDARGRDDDDDEEEDEEGEAVDGDDGDDDDGGDEGEGPLEQLVDRAVIGTPFAISGDVALVKAEAVLQHEDGRKFSIDLLSDRIKVSPHTGEKYTHMLAVAPVDDDQIIAEVVKQVMQNNGVTVDDLVRAGAGAGKDAEDDDDEEIPRG